MAKARMSATGMEGGPAEGGVWPRRVMWTRPPAPVRVRSPAFTSADGRIDITLRDNTPHSAGPNSILVAEKLGFDITTHAGVIDAALERGTLAVTSGQIVRQSPQAVRFRTPNAILGLRGTSFVVDAVAAAADEVEGERNRRVEIRVR